MLVPCVAVPAARRAGSTVILLLLAAATACTPGGDSFPSPRPPPPPGPTITAAGLLSDGWIHWYGWETRPYTLRIEGNHLRDAAPYLGADWYLEVTRVVDERVMNVSGPTFTSKVSLDGPSEAESITFDLGDALPHGGYVIRLSAGGRLVASTRIVFLLFPPPEVTGIDRPSVCLGGYDEQVTLLGRNLVYFFGESTYQALLEDEQGALTLPVVGGVNCAPNPLMGYPWTVCEGFQVTLPRARGAGAASLTLQYGSLWQAPPARNATTSFVFETDGQVQAPSHPVAAVDAPLDLTVYQGGPFRMVNGAGPVVRLGGAVVQATAEGCAATPFPSVQHCQSLRHTVPQGFAPGSYKLEVTTEAGCGGSAGPMQVVERPVLDGFGSPFMCDGLPFAGPLGTGLAGVEWSYSIGGTGPWTPLPTSGFSGFASLPLGSSLLRATTLSEPPVVSQSAWLAHYPGPLRVDERPQPGLLFSGGFRPVTVWVDRAIGVVQGRLLPLDGGTPVPVALSASGLEQTFNFPALGGDRSYYVEFTDESPCGPSRTLRGLETRSDPVLLAWDFDVAGQAPIAYSAAGMSGTGPVAGITAGAGLTGSAATGRADANVGDWYLGWWPYLPAGDLGQVRFELKAAGTGAPSSAAGLLIKVSEYYGQYLELRTQLTPPAPGTWTHYEVRLDEPTVWTVTEPSGATRAATRWDLQGRIQLIEILGSWWAGPGDVAVDDLVIELAR